MKKLMEKLLALIEDLFDDDIDEDAKETIAASTENEIEDRLAIYQTSRTFNPLLILDIVLSVLVAIPTFGVLPMAGTKLFHPEGNLYFEHLFILVAIAVCTFFLFNVLRKYMYVALLVLLMAYAINHNEKQPSASFLDSVIQDYKTASRKVIEADISFRSYKKVKSQISQNNDLEQILSSGISSKSRNFAVSAATQFYINEDLYDEYGDVVRYFSLFKYLSEHFNYVNDPVGIEYYSTAEETIDNNLSGDCDDRSALIYISIKAIGGQARLILVRGHIYPEVRVGSVPYFEANIVPLLDSLFEQEYTPDYFHHVDRYDQVWLAMDFGNYPGERYSYADIEDIMY